MQAANHGIDQSQAGRATCVIRPDNAVMRYWAGCGETWPHRRSARPATCLHHQCGQIEDQYGFSNQAVFMPFKPAKTNHHGAACGGDTEQVAFKYPGDMAARRQPVAILIMPGQTDIDALLAMGECGTKRIKQ